MSEVYYPFDPMDSFRMMELIPERLHSIPAGSELAKSMGCTCIPLADAHGSIASDPDHARYVRVAFGCPVHAINFDQA